MLKYTCSNKLSSLCILLNHDDETREYKYLDENLLNLAKEQDWSVTSMQKDFKIIFSAEKAKE